MHKIERYRPLTQEDALAHVTAYTMQFYTMFETDPRMATTYWRSVERNVMEQFGLDFPEFSDLAEEADEIVQTMHSDLDDVKGALYAGQEA